MARKSRKQTDLADDVAEAFDEAIEDERVEVKSGELQEHQQDAFEKWEAFWRLGCDWHASPEAWQAWNGAIDLISEYLANGFSENEFYHSIPKMGKVVEKLKRFKVK